MPVTPKNISVLTSLYKTDLLPGSTKPFCFLIIISSSCGKTSIGNITLVAIIRIAVGNIDRIATALGGTVGEQDKVILVNLTKFKMTVTAQVSHFTI